MLIDSLEQLSSAQVVVAGAISGLTSRFLISPLDVVKIRLQLAPFSGREIYPETAPYRNTFTSFRRIYLEEGLTAFWKGNIPAEWLYLGYGSIQFVSYRHSSAFLSSHTSLSSSSVSFFAGASAALVATTLTYPCDLLRTRFAARRSRIGSQSIAEAVSHILSSPNNHNNNSHRKKKKNVTGLFAGLGASLAQIVPQMSLFFGFYSTLQPAIATRITNNQHSLLSHIGAPDFVAGAIASVAAKSIVYPFDTVRKRLQMRGISTAAVSFSAYPSTTIPMLRTIVAVEGPRALYRGLGIALSKSGPSSTLSIWIYERVIRLMDVRSFHQE